MIALQHDVWEGDSAQPVLSHVFYGATHDEAYNLLITHASFDEFLRAAITTGNFRGIPLRCHSSYREMP